MFDLYNRRINYLRVSVTDRCNLRCQYCMPEEGISKISHESMLSYEEIAAIVKVAVEQGITKVRLTGGEPLVRKGIEDLVKMLAGIGGIEDLAMSTNGILLGQYAEKLKRAGLQRVNVSLDTLDPAKFRILTRNGELDQVLKGIDSAKSIGLWPIKINLVVNKFTDESDIQQVKEFARENEFEFRIIRQMDRANGNFWKVEGGDGGNCKQCNRLRLSSDGFFHPCLFSHKRFSVREHGALKALQLALNYKPESGQESGLNELYTIGG
jgi:cyclic pyranopterin phosphate synthase